ncbi:hypothetical protein AB0F15_33075 [Amycolatopsis sp. NPDC026612]|uniref:hypothetical protein n=1 Tax=Amycolatopsis sp. NPDC026612 TaxID=3155466 RepID=UPI00340B62A3
MELTWEQHAAIACHVASTDGQWSPVPEDIASSSRESITARLDVVSRPMVAGFVPRRSGIKRPIASGDQVYDFSAKYD